MLLQKLVEYSYRIDDLPPPLYSETPVRYLIELTPDGIPLSPRPRDTANPSDRGAARGRRIPAPSVTRSSAIKPLLLADTGQYTFGLVRDDSRQERVEMAHQAYIELLRRCRRETKEQAVEAVLHFLESDPLTQLELSDDFDPGAKITFLVGGKLVIDLPSVQKFWFEVNTPEAAKRMQCVVCGHIRPVEERLKGNIKGIPGGQPSGTALISANEEAFESWGLTASLTSPICADCAERFTRATNDLLADQSTSYRVGNTKFIFWTTENSEFDPTVITEPTTDKVEALFKSVANADRPEVLDSTRFYSTALSAAGGRAVVRDWIETTVGEAQERIIRWFRLQEIVSDREDGRPLLGLYALAGATVRDLRDFPTPMARALWRSAFGGSPLPPDLMMQAIRRSRAEQQVTRARAALIKLVLLSGQQDQLEGHMVGLDPDNSSTGYQCGRLLAVLESIQRAALQGLTTTVVDRFYGTASSAPLTVFPRLLKGARPHLARLERDRRGAYSALEQRLEDIHSRIDGFPRTLTIRDQGMFALGFYHQRAHDRAQAREAAGRRQEVETGA